MAGIRTWRAARLLIAVAAAGCGENRSVHPDALDAADTGVDPEAADHQSESPADTGPDDADEDAAIDRNTGDPCEDASGCTGPGASCITEFPNPTGGVFEFPGGYCTSECGDGGDCGPDGFCMDTSSFGDFRGCLRTCSSDEECRQDEGYVCTNWVVFPRTFCALPLSWGG